MGNCSKSSLDQEIIFYILSNCFLLCTTEEKQLNIFSIYIRGGFSGGGVAGGCAPPKNF